MRRLLLFLAFVCCYGFINTALAQRIPATAAIEALQPEARANVAQGDALLDFRTRTIPEGRLDTDDGVLRAVYRIHTPIRPATSLEETARTYLQSAASQFGWAESTQELELHTVQRGRYSSHVVFQQTLSGVPVYNRQVKVSLNKAGQPTMALSGYAPHLRDLQAFNPNPTVAASAIQARVQELVADPNATVNAPTLVVYPSEVPRLAWRILVWPSNVSAEWEVLIDAHTRETIRLFNQTTHAHWTWERDETDSTPAHAPSPPSALPETATTPLPLRTGVTGSGLVFDPDPLTTAGVEYGAPYVDADDTDVDELNAERIAVTLNDITQGGDGLYRLEGPFAFVDGSQSIGGVAYTPPAESDPNAFHYLRSDQAFEAVMAYYHIDTSQRYVQSLDIGRDIQKLPVHVNPHGLGNRDDSKFYVNLNAIALGDGGIDDAEDADVIWHEYGHALLQGSAPGLLGSQEGQALHEGWADYWAASYSRGLIDAGKVPSRDWRKVFTWDGNHSWSGRILNHQGHYPEDTRCDTGGCGSWIYQDGLLWATTLMEIYDVVGREVIDRLNLASHGYLNAPVTFRDAAQALIQADIDYHDGAHISVLIDILGARGLVDTSTFGPVVAHEPIPLVEQPGSTVSFEAEVTAISSAISSVMLHYSLDGGSFQSVALATQGDNRYSGDLSLPSDASEVAYYLEATDQGGLRTQLPTGAPQETYSFSIGLDNVGPHITHLPIPSIALQGWPLTVVANVEDNQGIDSVWVAYTIRYPDGSILIEDAFGLTYQQEQYTGTFPEFLGQLIEGSAVEYSIVARDVALTPNETVMPPTGAYRSTIVSEGTLATFTFEIPVNLEATGVWNQGVPTYGVQVAHSGQNVWATGLDAAYPDTEHRSSLDLPSFDLSEFDQAYLVFWHWYDFEYSNTPTKLNLWDGGNIKVSTNKGATWSVLEPIGGYTGTLEQGTPNPLQGEAAFGSYSFGWRQEVVALPQTDNVRIRFDMGTDGSNELDSRYYAGWYLDDVQITTLLPQDNAPPALLTPPADLLIAASGQTPPLIRVQAEDDTGLEAVLVDYEITTGSGDHIPGTVRLEMSPTDLTTFQGKILPPSALSAGDYIVYRLRFRDFAGNTVLYPDDGSLALRIEYRLAENLSALNNVRASGPWQQEDNGWTLAPEGGSFHNPSSLVLEPFDLPQNSDNTAFVLTHRYKLDSGVGGNVKLSTNGGATWTLLKPEGDYGVIFSPGSDHPMDGEGVFSGQQNEVIETSFDLSTYAGQQVRIRVDAGGTRDLNADEIWSIQAASLIYDTLDDSFEIPRELVLHPNFPDPFAHSTTISYTVPEAMPIRLELFNMLGQRVHVLVDGEQTVGTHTLSLNRGTLASGVYILRMQAGTTQYIEQMIITR